MLAEERRKELLQLLQEKTAPIRARELAQLLGVSRQVGVGDVALLRARGNQILATPKGYQMFRQDNWVEVRYACAAGGSSDALRRELYAIVDNGGILQAVEASDSVVGIMMGRVNVSNRYEADHVICQVQHKEKKNGVIANIDRHVAVVRCRDNATAERIRMTLQWQNCLADAQRQDIADEG